jgi:hypothetical protein
MQSDRGSPGYEDPAVILANQLKIHFDAGLESIKSSVWFGPR